MADGYFNHTQCLGSSCWCVDQCGKKFRGTEHPVSTVNTNDCALKRRCGGDPCDTATCELYPQATCRVEEQCGECLPVFSIGDQRVSCLQGSSKVEKAGLCPDPSSITVRRGIFACREDADCHGNKKCCGNGGGMMCTNPLPKIHEGQCPRPWLLECDSHRRADHCEFDSQCPQSNKCCESGCGKACRDTSNHVNEKLTVGYLLTKPGQCLSVTRMNCSTVFECTTDQGCGSNLKCCSNGCGMECVEPITLVKYGQCPRPSYEASQCTGMSPDDMCMHDKDCHSNQKCCNDGCQNICIEPWKYVKPGECPGESEQDDHSRDCSVDMDCPDSMKCCQDSSTPQLKCLNPRFQIALPLQPAGFCYQDRQRYHHGDEWSRDPCSLCRCWAGVIECLRMTCATPPEGCEAVVIQGRCCPDFRCSGVETGFSRCPSLTGRNHSHLEVWSKDDCTQCMCYDGEVTCTTLSCIPIAPVNSTRFHSVPQPGSCCPRLVYSELRSESDNHCFDTRGVMHHTGDRWHEDPCTECHCHDNRVECLDRSHSCPRLPHPSCRLLEVKGQCCPDVKCSVIEGMMVLVAFILH
ncbi:cysteine-rich motor neuron 1 protein-like [Strongylocentrotus purpuratus]|uniref:Uncharacterized protein n=1 Tax=Strongylocentrotus purpuratus TaxID=7668 RepID=A0A7M7NG54_STRPU|nr:cysteine-rich motor neuron 1 protein-like [Strongylocentrotus purpuratus]